MTSPIAECKDKKLIISILSDSPFIPTGYSNQSKQLADYFRSLGHEVHFLANAYTGSTIKKVEMADGRVFDYYIYGQGKQQYFADLISSHLKETKSDVFIILLDTFMLHGGNAWFTQIDTSPAQTYFWFPSDGGGGMPIGCELILKKCDKQVAMSKFGQKQVLDYYNIKSEHIPHGCDSKRFYKLPEEQRIELRKKWGINDKFVIGVVARNQPRKFLDRTIKTMFLLKNKISNWILFLHLDPTDQAQIWDIRSLVKRYNLENRVVYTGMAALKGFPESEMNNVYNVMDCFLLTTSGEGFGIPIIEAMSCEVPVVATDYTTTPELVINNKAGLGINLAGVETIDMFKYHSKEYDNLCVNGTITGSWEVERGVCDVNDAAEKIISLYINSNLRKEMGQNGRNAVIEKYDFETKVGPAWDKLIWQQ